MNLFDFATQEDNKQNLVKQASEAYEIGNPIMSDEEFDLLAETGIDIDPRNFRIKVDHPFPMGSLSKVKEAKLLKDWFNQSKGLVRSPKLDGLSLRASYVDGEIVQVVTRGNGYVGNDVTVNALMCNVQTRLNSASTVEIRYEGVIKKIHKGKFEKNLRGIASGMIGAKDPRPELELIDFIAIDVVVPGKAMSIAEKQELLYSLVDPEYKVDSAVVLAEDVSFEYFEATYESWKQNMPYAIDGMVVQKFDSLSDLVKRDPKVLLPEDMIALKFSTEEAETVIKEIEWTLGQHAKLTPVLCIEPVELDGTTVSRISAANYSLLAAAGLGVGAEITCIKSGEIIPKVKDIITPSQRFTIPFCPECGTLAVLNESGVDAVCPNKDCIGGELVKLQKTFKLFGIDFVSDSTINALFRAGHNTLEKLFALSVSDIVSLEGFGQKSAQYFVDALKTAKLTEAQVIKSAFLKGIGERKATPLLNHYGSIDRFLVSVAENGLDPIEGFGPIQTTLINKMYPLIETQNELFKKLGVTIIPHVAPNSNARVVCYTGACPKYSQKELKAVLEDLGYQVSSSVTKETTLLLCADTSGNSSKLTKARKNGIDILSYEDFLVANNI